MTSDEKLDKILEIVNTYSTRCLCTMRESCGVCRPDSISNKLRNEIREVIKPTPKMEPKDYGASLAIRLINGELV